MLGISFSLQSVQDGIRVKTTITALIMLLLGGGIFDVARGCRECTTVRCLTVAQASEKSEATLTLSVRGMMKSKSGAT